MTQDVSIREMLPGDYDDVVAALDEWLSAPKARELLPADYVARFADTCLIARTEGAEGAAAIAGFLVGFVSPAHRDVGYVHFVWVSPDQRRRGLGRRLYEREFEVLRERGCRMIEAVSTPGNRISSAFHRGLGFSVPDDGTQDVPATPDLVVLSRPL